MQLNSNARLLSVPKYLDMFSFVVRLCMPVESEGESVDYVLELFGINSAIPVIGENKQGR